MQGNLFVPDLQGNPVSIEKLDVFKEAQSVGLDITKTSKSFVKRSNSQNITKIKNK